MTHLPDPASITLARLGFGCSGLMARLNRRQSLQLLEAALDAGIRHFDTARLYGYGEAESVLGEFAAPRRSQITITTKVGILPPARSPVLDLAKQIGRHVAAFAPGLRRAMRGRAERMVQAGVFDVQSMQRSLETSLRELRTDHVDVLLLHDCGPSVLTRDDVLDFLEQARARGQVVSYGIATDIATARQAVETSNNLSRIVQFASSPFENNVARVASASRSWVITHSALGARFQALRAQLARDPALARNWGGSLDFDPLASGELGRLFLAAALQANPHGTVLFSSANPGRIRMNAALVADEQPRQAQIEVLRRLAATWHSENAPVHAVG